MAGEHAAGAAGGSTLGWVGGALLALGPLAAHAEVVRPLIGFGAFALGGLIGLVTLGRSIVRVVRGRRLGAGDWLGTAAGAAFLMVIAGSARGGAPRINDFTTDTANPPGFVAVATLAENQGRDLRYPSEYSSIQAGCCPDLKPEASALAPAVVFPEVLAVTRDLFGWEVVEASAPDGRLEAIATSPLFRFRDDVVVRVNPGPAGGSIIDIRSKSRDGKGDMGANANRIRGFLGALRARLSRLVASPG